MFAEIGVHALTWYTEAGYGSFKVCPIPEPTKELPMELTLSSPIAYGGTLVLASRVNN